MLYSVRMNSYKNARVRLLSNPKVSKAYADLEPEFLIIQKLIEYRLTKGVTQAELAKAMRTKQSAISRFESGKYHPTIHFLRKITNALGATLEIKVS